MKNKIGFKKFFPGYLLGTALIIVTIVAVSYFVYGLVGISAELLKGTFSISDDKLLLSYLIGVVIAIILFLIMSKIVKAINTNVVNSVRMSVIDKLIRIPLKESIVYNTSTVKTMLLNEVSEMDKTINKLLPFSIIDVTAPLVMFIFLAVVLDTSIGLVLLALSSILLFLVLFLKVDSKISALLLLGLIYVILDASSTVIITVSVIFVIFAIYHIYDLHKIRDYSNIKNIFNDLMVKLNLSNSSNGIKNFSNADIKLENIKFGPKNLTTYLKRGEKTVVIGEHSEEMLNYLAFFKAYVGTISIKGTNFTELSISAYYKHLAILDQETFILDESINDTLRKAKVMIGDDELVEACRKAKIDEKIQSLEKKYDAKTSELDKNELKLLGLARYFIKDPDIVLIDEIAFFEGVDYEVVAPSYKRFIEGRTAVVVNPLDDSLTNNDKLIDLAKL